MSIIHLRLLGGVYLSALENGRERLIPMPPKPTALLAYLAVAGADGRALRRDTLLALFWPELPDARARAALRQVLFRVRRILGAGALRADRGSVALAPGALLCDVIAFEGHLAAGNPVAALELYRGDLLAGFYVDGMSEELEAWIEGERARLKRRAFQASWSAADEAERCHDASAATTWARRVVALVPDDEIAARRYIELLDRCGDRAGALRAAAELAGRMAEEFGSEPSVETRALVAAIRNRGVGEGVSGVAASAGSPAPTVISAAVPVPPEADPAKSVLRKVRAVGAAIWPVRRLQSWPRSTRASVFPAAAVVATTLALAGGELLASRGTRAAAPEVTIASPVARRLYEEGLGRYYAGDDREAARLLHAAVVEDGSCAMCAYYASLADARFDDASAVRMLRLAMHRAGSVSQPERMFIRFGWADATNSPNRLAVADSLAMRYEAWPQAQLAVGEALWMEGQYLDATRHLRLVISADPRDTTASSGDCPACTAEFLLVNAYKAADSMPAAVRAARAWVRVSPSSRSAWLELANALAGSGRYAEARAALDSSIMYAAGQRDDPIGRAEIEIRAGMPTRCAESSCRRGDRTGFPAPGRCGETVLEDGGPLRDRAVPDAASPCLGWIIRGARSRLPSPGTVGSSSRGDGAALPRSRPAAWAGGSLQVPISGRLREPHRVRRRLPVRRCRAGHRRRRRSPGAAAGPLAAPSWLRRWVVVAPGASPSSTEP